MPALFFAVAVNYVNCLVLLLMQNLDMHHLRHIASAMAARNCATTDRAIRVHNRVSALAVAVVELVAQPERQGTEKPWLKLDMSRSACKWFKNKAEF